MRRDSSVWIGILLFLLLILLVPLWTFPILENQLNTQANQLSKYQKIASDGAILEWQGRNAYLRVPEAYDKSYAEKVADEIDGLTGVRDVAIIYDASIPYTEPVADPTPLPPSDEEADALSDTSDDRDISYGQTEAGQGSAEDSDAAQEAIAEVEEAVEALLDFTTIEFETGTSDLTDSSQSAIAEIAAVLMENAAVKLKVVGHTDAQGDEDKNLALSLDRARSVVDALLAHGISQDRLTAEGKGETEPIADNDTPEGRKLNRRVEFIGLEN